MESAHAIRIAIIGASGYTGEELVNILLNHPKVTIVELTSRQYAGQLLTEVFPRLRGRPGASSLRFTAPEPAKLVGKIDAAFTALPHGTAASFVKELVEKGIRVIDLSADFRLRSPETYKMYYGIDHPAPELLAKAVYALPELNRKDIEKAHILACPGCYPTSILLPLLPLIRQGVIRPEPIIINSLSGVTGAGRKAELAYLFAECNESLRPYSVPQHRHVSEIEQELSQAAGRDVRVRFTPHLVPVNRGILTTIVAQPAADASDIEAKIESALRNTYQHAPFVDLLSPPILPDTKYVTGTNRIQIAWRYDARTGYLLLFSAIDNLLKGAAGQAVQVFNIAYGLEETLGLPL